MFNSTTWSILGVLLFVYLGIRLYRFRLYIKKYLIPYEINIVSDTMENYSQHVSFVVRFGRGFFNRQYFTATGDFESVNPLSKADLRNMLFLTESANFPSGSLSVEHLYSFVPSTNTNGLKHYSVEYKIISDSLIDQLILTAKK